MLEIVKKDVEFTRKKADSLQFDVLRGARELEFGFYCAFCLVAESVWSKSVH